MAAFLGAIGASKRPLHPLSGWGSHPAMNTDVVALAKERQAKLAAEIAKLDNFIHLAAALLKHAPVRELKVEERVPDAFKFLGMASSK